MRCYKIKWMDADTGEVITKYVPMSEARDYMRDLHMDIYAVNIAATVVDYNPEFDETGYFEFYAG
jgi:hypothetical protein